MVPLFVHLRGEQFSLIVCVGHSSLELNETFERPDARWCADELEQAEFWSLN